MSRSFEYVAVLVRPRHRRSARRARMLAAAALASVAAATPALAQTSVTWINPGTGNYVDPANWSNNQTPTVADNNFLQINNGGTAVVNPADAAEGAFLNLGLQPGDSGTLLVNGGTLTLGELRVGGRQTIPTSLTSSTPNGGGTRNLIPTPRPGQAHGRTQTPPT